MVLHSFEILDVNVGKGGPRLAFYGDFRHDGVSVSSSSAQQRVIQK